MPFGTDAVELQLARIAIGEGHLPDPALLERFILHLLDRYLVPVGYEYFFDPAKLGLLSHFARNDSYRVLEQLLRRSAGARTFEVDQHVMRAVDACPVGRSSQSSFLGRQVRRFSAWMARRAGSCRRRCPAAVGTISAGDLPASLVLSPSTLRWDPVHAQRERAPPP